MYVASDAAGALTRVLPMRMVARKPSIRARMRRTRPAFFEPLLSRYSRVVGFELMRAVSEELKKALRTIKNKSRRIDRTHGDRIRGPGRL